LAFDGGLLYAEIGRMLGDLSSANIGRVYKKVANEFENKRKFHKEIIEIAKKYI
jgi:hypothetical protein